MSAASRLLAAYRGEPARTRLHVRGRWTSGPLAEVAALAGTADRFLDVGCGHGLLALLLATRSPGAVVLGVDVDPEKVVVARRAGARLGFDERARFEVVPQGWVPPPASADVVALVDVLYLLPPDRAQAFLRAAVAAVAPGGRIVVKEMADAPGWKRWLALHQERLATGPLRMTQGSVAGLHPERAVVSELVAAGLGVERVDLGRRRIHPHVAFVGERPVPGT